MLANPGLLVEVLSPSVQNCESYDRGAKFKLYKGLASFQDYLFIENLGIHLTLTDIYAHVEFNAPLPLH